MRAPAFLLGLLVAVLPGGLASQDPPVRRLSLEEALRLAIPASETLELAQAAVRRAQGDEAQAHSTRWPQLAASLGYTRLLRSQFQDIDFGGGGEDEFDFSELPFGRANTYSAGISLSQTLFSGGRISGQSSAAEASRRRAQLGVSSAEAQLTLDVVTAYYDAVLAERRLAIAQTALAQADTTLRQTQARREVGTQPEFDVLRARVARDNQRTALIQRRSESVIAGIRLRQLLNLPADTPLQLSTPLEDTGADTSPTLAGLLARTPDTAAANRLAVRQAAEGVRTQEGLLRAAKAERIPSLVLTSQYARLGYPADLIPDNTRFFTDWSFNLGVSFPLFTGGRLSGSQAAAEASLQDAELRVRQVTEQAQLDARIASTALEAAEAAWDASSGTVEEARRAYEIAEIRFREGISTQTELLDARLALETAETVRAQAARDLRLARVRLALLDRLPLTGTAAPSGPAGAAPVRQAATAPAAGASSLSGLTGILP